MTNFRKVIYENSSGERVNLTIPFKSFVFELEGMGFEYENDIQENNYTDRLSVNSTRLTTSPISGTLHISDLLDNNQKIYEVERSIATILNYDQLVRKVTGKDVSGKLYYTGASGIEVYVPALIKGFTFGEIQEEEGQRVLEVDIQFDRLSKTWLSSTPKTINISMAGNDESHYHPFSHPFSHGEVSIEGNGKVANIGGNDLAKFVLKIDGEVSEFDITFTDQRTGEVKIIKFDTTIQSSETLIIDNFQLSAKLVTSDGESNASSSFDFLNGDIPFFDLLPNTVYAVSISSAVLRGNVTLEVYESWVAVP